MTAPTSRRGPSRRGFFCDAHLLSLASMRGWFAEKLDPSLDPNSTIRDDTSQHRVNWQPRKLLENKDQTIRVRTRRYTVARLSRPVP
jgi:hypothetical protein